MSVATKNDFFQPAKRRFAEFDVPNFKRVRIQSLNEREASEYETSIIARKGGLVHEKLKSARLRLLVLCVVDDSDTRIFSDGDEKATALNEMDGGVSKFIFDRCQEHCGFNAGDIEDAVKNSDNAPAVVSQ